MSIVAKWLPISATVELLLMLSFTIVITLLIILTAVIICIEKSLMCTRATGQPMLMSPDEAMRRLRQLTMRRSVWTTRVLLAITSSELMVFDAETNAVMERFPLSLVYGPTAMMSSVTDDQYGNVVVLIVLGDPQQNLPPEVHIFQCLQQRASTACNV